MKYIFFDIDGTLVNYKNKQYLIPDSTRKTIKRLKEKGHLVGIATGRQLSTALPICRELNIDNLVSDGGYGLMYKGKIIHINPLEKEKVIPFTKELLEKKIPFAYMINPEINELYASPLMLADKEIHNFETIPVNIDESFNYTKHDVYKIFFESYKGQEDMIKSIDVRKIMRYFDNHLAYEPDDKYKGVKELVELDGGNVEDIVFFGDGLNDIPMFEHVPFNIAMGNAIDELKEIACFITKDIEDDGIEYACQYFGFI